jgi:Flp pilus assembly protein TadG
MCALDPRNPARGVTAVFVAIVLTALAGFLALVINVGHGYVIRNQLQNAADASALAAARELDGTDAGLTAATDVAVDYAGRHRTDAQGDPDNWVRVVPAAGDVEFGNWDPSKARAEAFRVITGRTPNDLRWINAIHVTATRQARVDGNRPMPVAMGPILGKEQVDVRADAIAVLGGACRSECALPVAFASCILVNEDGSLNCDATYVFNSDTVDNIGFTNLDPTTGSVNTADIKSILEGTCRDVGVGDPVGVGNGANLNPSIADLFNAIAASGKEVSAPVVTLGSCPAKFTEHGTAARIIGFAKVRVVEAESGADKHLTLQIRCDKLEDEVTGGGCEFFGATPIQPSLAR